jgi:hypothetical protein
MALLPDAEALVAIYPLPPLLHAAGVALVLPPQPPVEKPVEHFVHAPHGATIRGRCPRLACDRSIGVSYRRLAPQGGRAAMTRVLRECLLCRIRSTS